jgi:hypothetical protein
MRAIRIPAGLSGLVIAKKLEQRFGMLGFARMVKLVELVAEMTAPAEVPSVVVAWGDLLIALGCNAQDAGDFLTYCEHARVLDRGNDDGRARLTLLGELAALLDDAAPSAAPALPVLFTQEQQWVEWFKEEWACPPYLANDPCTRQLFRRWIATNVTIEEVEAAVELAKEAREAPTPAALHDHLKTVRNTKIERARR